MTIKTLLIANRGEIACRIAKTARKFGITPVGIHSEADANARHVREIGRSILIGKGPASESYLNIDAVMKAAREAGADAIHPGYGFLSENPDFARAVEAAGIIFMGPTPETLEKFGDKASAKKAAIAANVPVISGAPGAKSDPDEIYAAVLEMGLPVLLKAVGGGGGRGQRLVRDEKTLRADIEGALREARSTFGSEGLLLERFLGNARHIEIQIIGDGEGKVLHLHERDCTLQRRHQKVIEEAPAPNLSRALAGKIASDAVRLGQSLNYRGLGTVEFLLAGEDYFFLEVNPRLQVEHPVTEAITGLDLVGLQIDIANGKGIALEQADVPLNGHAVEARFYAEDPAMDFTPSTGRLTTLSLPEGLRVDTGVEEGDAISPFYDPMIAKLISHGESRDEALDALARALNETAIDGVETNRRFLSNLARNEDFRAMKVHTRWIDGELEALTAPEMPANPALWRAVAAHLYVTQDRAQKTGDSWRNRDVFTGWRLGLGEAEAEANMRVTLTGPGESEGVELRLTRLDQKGGFTAFGPDGTATYLVPREIAPGRWQISHAGETYTVTVRIRDTRIEIEVGEARLLYLAASPLAFAAAGAAADRLLTSPLTGMIIKLMVAEGDAVTAGDTVAILESMKLEISIKAATSGRAANISIAEGAMVDRGQAIVEILENEEEAAE
ncbi:MAG: ATP-grasp domain-containing protein [Alphaproteobacteria bacterium]|nr:MAG: ATP-grasp domain-containing protein [Alphaproteobacteria bacterium]